MSTSDKIKAIDNKIEQNKAQYNLDRQAAKISALSSRNISKYEFVTSKYFLPEKGLLEKAAAIKRFQYSLLGEQLKNQTSVAEKQYQKFDKAFESDKKAEDKTENKKLVYDNVFAFYKDHNIKEFSKRSFDLKLNDLKEFKDKLELLYYNAIEIKPNNEHKIKDLEER